MAYSNVTIDIEIPFQRTYALCRRKDPSQAKKQSKAKGGDDSLRGQLLKNLEESRI